MLKVAHENDTPDVVRVVVLVGRHAAVTTIAVQPMQRGGAA